MTPKDQTNVKYIGVMFGSIVGGHLGEVQNIAAAYGGNIQAMMRDLSGSPYFTNTLAAGSSRDIAHALVNRIAGNTAAAGERAWAVDWMEGSYAAGRTWGEIMFEAVTALDGITTGAWAATAAAMRARAAYNVAATEAWAWNVTNLDTLRDVYSAAVTPAGFTPSTSNPAAIAQLQSANAALATAAAGLSGQASGASYTVVGADVGRAIMMGDGNDTVTIGYGDLDKPALLSGGAGEDTLIVTRTGAIDDFLSKNGGFYDDQPIRGFEKIVFQGMNPGQFGSMEGIKEITLGGYGESFDTTVIGVDNGTRINLRVDDTAYLRFGDAARYNNAGQPSQAPQAVGSLELNVQASSVGRAYLSATPAKDLTVNVAAPANSVFQWFHHAGGHTFAPVDMPYLENYTVSTTVKTKLALNTPNIRDIDLSGTTGLTSLSIDAKAGVQRTDGVQDVVTIHASQTAMALNFSTVGTPYSDTTLKFVGDLKAGSQIVFNNDTRVAQNVPITKAVFDGDFSQVGALKAAGLSEHAGSIFTTDNVELAAVYFKGVAPAGTRLGTVEIADRATTIIRVDSAQGLNFDLNGGGVAIVINNGSGSVLDNVRASMDAKLAVFDPFRTLTFNMLEVNGGRLLWADYNGDGQLGGQTFPFPWKVTGDIVIMETTSANLAAMSQSVEAMGFNPLFDPFAS